MFISPRVRCDYTASMFVKLEKGAIIRNQCSFDLGIGVIKKRICSFELASSVISGRIYSFKLDISVVLRRGFSVDGTPLL